MGYEARVLRVGDVDPPVAAAWDALPPRRGTQADYHDSHAWLSSWSQAAGPATAPRLRIPAVLDGGRPVALPSSRTTRRWGCWWTRSPRRGSGSWR
jgi:hypothetical protein